MHLTLEHARRFLLIHHHLYPPRSLSGKQAVLDYIRKVGCIQFDPINVVGQNPDLVLQSRVADFTPAMLRELLYQDRQLLDGWDKNMSIYSLADWPYFARGRENARKGFGKSPAAVEAVMPQIRAALEERGPLSSIDIQLGQTVDWSWAPTSLSRAAMETMYFTGELVIHHKVNTRRIYDFAHRHLPADLLAAPDPNPTTEEYHDWYVLRRMGSIGMLWDRAGEAFLGVREIKTPQRQAALARLLAAGKILEVSVEGITVPMYLRAEDLPTLERALEPAEVEPRAAILAPLDNLMWERKQLKAIFGFDYVWEVYKPLDQCKYGYYVLPILYGDRFIARFEPGQDKKRKALLVKNWWWEPDVEITPAVQSALRECFACFAAYLGAERLEVQAEASDREGLGFLQEVDARETQHS